jgi:hypothetical protein
MADEWEKEIIMEPYKYSGFGIASFITSVASAILVFITMVVAGVLQATTPGGMDNNSETTIIIGLFIIGFLFATLIALGLGVGGLFQRKRKKVFSIFGIIFSSVTLICTILVIVIGLTVQ